MVPALGTLMLYLTGREGDARRMKKQKKPRSRSAGMGSDRKTSGSKVTDCCDGVRTYKRYWACGRE